MRGAASHRYARAVTFFGENGDPWNTPPRRDPSPFDGVHRRRATRRLLLLSPVAVVALVVGIWFAPQLVAWWGTGDKPSAQAVALAERMYLTGAGTDLFLSTLPSLTDLATVNTECAGAGSADAMATGCFVSGPAHRLDRIYLYQPQDPRAEATVVTAAAHEMLHAAYSRMTSAEQSSLDSAMAAELAKVPADDPVRDQIAASVGDDQTALGTETFAYLGTEISLPGGFSAGVEQVYSRFIADRTSLVGVFRAFDDETNRLIDALRTAHQHVADLDAAAVQAQADFTHASDRYTQESTRYSTDLAEFNAADPGTREQATVTVTYPDGRWYHGPWRGYFDWATKDLAEQRQVLDGYPAKIATARQAAADASAAYEAQRADTAALIESAYPDSTTPRMPGTGS